MATNITLNDIIDISVDLSPVVSYRRALNSALFLSESDVIKDDERIVEVSNLEEMADIGFSSGDAEYLAAQLYFGQSPKPPKLFIGKKLDSESYVEAITACRMINFEWYALIIPDAIIEKMTFEDIKSVISYIDAASPEAIFCLNLTNNIENVQTYLAQLATLGSKRTFVQYDENDLNKNKTAVAGIIGYALGYNKKLSKAFTLAYKSVVNLSPNEITSAELRSYIKNNINIYVKQGYYYSLFRQGVMLNGDHFDEIYYIDSLVNDLRNTLMEALISNPKIPQTNVGLSTLTAVISSILDNYVDVEFIQPGVWLGPNVKELVTGDTLSQGYLIVFDDIDSQDASDRASRIAPNCYICAKLAGAIEYIVLGISVSR